METPLVSFCIKRQIYMLMEVEKPIEEEGENIENLECDREIKVIKGKG